MHNKCFFLGFFLHCTKIDLLLSVFGLWNEHGRTLGADAWNVHPWPPRTEPYAMYEIFTVEVKRTPKGESRFRERVAAGKCLMCDEPTEDAHPIGPRGHCPRCKSRLERARAKLPPRKQAQLEAELIRTGRYARPQELREVKRRDGLQKALEQIA